MYSIAIVLLIIGVIMIISIFIAGIIIIKRQSNKITFYENFISEVQQMVNKTYLNMKSVDILGSFEADDEIGDSFKIIKELITKLNELVQ
jgi:hypothetical protein